MPDVLEFFLCGFSIWVFACLVFFGGGFLDEKLDKFFGDKDGDDEEE